VLNSIIFYYSLTLCCKLFLKLITPQACKYRLYNLRCNPTAVKYYERNKIRSRFRLSILSQRPRWHSCQVHPDASLFLASDVQKLRANTVHSRAEYVFILEHYFTSKLLSAVCEAFTDKDYTLVTTFRNTGNVCDNSTSSDKRDEITTVPISNSAKTQYWHWLRRSVGRGVYAQWLGLRFKWKTRQDDSVLLHPSRRM
jgi:hypothetical protein